jgi:hypothetical protein
MKQALVCIGFLLAPFLRAQEPLTNQTIMNLVKAGVGAETIAGMIHQQPGKYSLSADDLIALKKAGVPDNVIAALFSSSAASAQPVQPVINSYLPTAPIMPAPNLAPLILHDATPVRLRLNRNLSSADAKAGDSVDFEVLDDIKVDDVLVIARGGTAIATITQAEAKKRMARGGKLDVNMDYVRLVNGDKVTVRAVKETKGGGHTGAMTGAIVATSLVFWPAAPFFLFMHGKDVMIPKGTEITAYVDGDITLDRAKFYGVPQVPPAAPLAAPVAAPMTPITPSVAPPIANGSMVDITFTSNPPGVIVSMYGQPIGRTPFTTRLQPGTYRAVFSGIGYGPVTKDVAVGAGFPTTVSATLQAAPITESRPE